MNVNEIGIKEETGINQLNDQNSSGLVTVTTGTGDLFHKEDIKKASLQSSEEKSDESNRNTNEREANEPKTFKHKEDQLSYLKKKRKRHQIENILDMDHLYDYLSLKDPDFDSYIYIPKSNNSNRTKKAFKVNKNNIETKKKEEPVFQAKQSQSQCHICHERAGSDQMKTCWKKNCNLSFCNSCLLKYKESENNLMNTYENIKEDIENNNYWQCLKCRNQCKCHRCRVSNRKMKHRGDQEKTPIEKEPIDLKKLIHISSISNTKVIQRKHISINDYDIIEIIDNNNYNDDNGDYNGYDYDYDYEFNSDENEDNDIIKALSNKEVTKLCATAKQCENYYCNYTTLNTPSALSSIQSSMSMSVLCLRCQIGIDDIDKIEMLRFSTKKELMNYMKYCFIYHKKVLTINNKAFAKNKKEFFKCNYLNFINHWKYYLPKAICKYCFMLMINMDDLLNQIKIIFNDDNLNHAHHFLGFPMNDLKSNGNCNANFNYSRKQSRKTFEAHTFKRKYRNKIRRINTSNHNTQANANNNNTDVAASSIRQTKAKQYNKNAIYDKEKNVIIIDKTKINCCINEEDSGLFDKRIQSKRDKKHSHQRQGQIQGQAKGNHGRYNITNRKAIDKDQSEQMKSNEDNSNNNNDNDSNDNSNHQEPNQQQQPNSKTLFASNKNILEIISIYNDIQKVIKEVSANISKKTQITSPDEYQAVLNSIKNYQAYITNHLIRIQNMRNAITNQSITIDINRQNSLIKQLNDLEDKCKHDLNTVVENVQLLVQCGREHLICTRDYCFLISRLTNISPMSSSSNMSEMLAFMTSNNHF